jgi:hypothetical protein
MTKQDLWPKEGKLKKGLIILGIVIIVSLLIVLLEEKTQFKAGKKLPLIIAFMCLAVWAYKPKEKTEPLPEKNNHE